MTELEPLEDFPDAGLVEDTAPCLPEGAILMHPEVLVVRSARTDTAGIAELAAILTTGGSACARCGCRKGCFISRPTVRFWMGSVAQIL